MQSINELLQTQLSKKNIILASVINQSVDLKTDKNIITNLIRNLLQNAITYSPEKSTITITATQQNIILNPINQQQQLRRHP